jgi:hypothetical protein
LSSCFTGKKIQQYLQYKGNASYDLTFTAEDQISASEVNGLGFSAKARRAAHRELIIRRKLGGTPPSKTITRRLQRQGSKIYVTINISIKNNIVLQLLLICKTYQSQDHRLTRIKGRIFTHIIALPSMNSLLQHFELRATKDTAIEDITHPTSLSALSILIHHPLTLNVTLPYRHILNKTIARRSVTRKASSSIRHSHQRQLLSVNHLVEESSHKKGEAAQQLLSGTSSYTHKLPRWHESESKFRIIRLDSEANTKLKSIPVERQQQIGVYLNWQKALSSLDRNSTVSKTTASIVSSLMRQQIEENLIAESHNFVSYF